MAESWSDSPLTEPRLELWGRAKNLVLLLELGLLNYRGIVHVFQLRGNEYKKCC